MTFWLSWARILNLIREISIPVLLFLEIGLFWYFRSLGPGFLNNLFAPVLFLGCLYWYIKKHQESLEFLVFLTLFLGYVALFNLQLAFSLPLWLAEIVAVIFVFVLFIYFKNSIFLALVISLCLAEIAFVLYFWPTNPLSKSFILTSLFYSFWYIVVKREKILNYLVLVGVVLILVMATTRWPAI